jgi:CHASE3 domain sensor protein
VSQYTRFADALAKVEQAHDVLDGIDRVVTRLLEAETGYRGYLLTARHAFLEPYEGVGPQTRGLLSRLEELVADNPSRQASAKRLASIAASKLEEMAQAVALHDAGDEDGARAAVAEGHGRRLMDADVKAFDEVYRHVLMMSDALADGIVEQFPDKFVMR